MTASINCSKAWCIRGWRFAPSASAAYALFEVFPEITPHRLGLLCGLLQLSPQNLPTMNASCALCGAPLRMMRGGQSGCNSSELVSPNPIKLPGPQEYPLTSCINLFRQSLFGRRALVGGCEAEQGLKDVAPPGAHADGSPSPDNRLVKLWLIRNNFEEPLNLLVVNKLANTPGWGFPFHAS